MDVSDYLELSRIALEMAAKMHASPWLLGPDEALRLRVLNAAAGVRVAAEGRVLRVDGRIEPFGFEHTPNTDRTETTAILHAGDGILLGLALRASAGAPRVGQCFATVEVVKTKTGDAVPVGALLAGYVTDSQRLMWPGSPAIYSCDGPGVIRSITGTNPAAGVEISDAVPTNARWRLLSWAAALVTDATVANRIASLIIDDGAAALITSLASAAQTASLTRTYQAAAWGALAGVTTNEHYLPLPPDLYLMGGYRVRTSTAAIVAGDNWGAPQLLVEEWIED